MHPENGTNYGKKFVRRHIGVTGRVHRPAIDLRSFKTVFIKGRREESGDCFGSEGLNQKGGEKKKQGKNPLGKRTKLHLKSRAISVKKNDKIFKKAHVDRRRSNRKGRQGTRKSEPLSYRRDSGRKRQKATINMREQGQRRVQTRGNNVAQTWQDEEDESLMSRTDKFRLAKKQRGLEGRISLW